MHGMQETNPSANLERPLQGIVITGDVLATLTPPQLDRIGKIALGLGADVELVYGEISIAEEDRQPWTPEESRVEAYETRVQNLLDENITSLLQRHAPGHLATHASNKLRREGLRTIRDVLVAGSDYVTDINDLGTKNIELVRSAIHAIDPDLRWQAQPTMGDIVQFCPDLTRLPAFLLTQNYVFGTLLGIKEFTQYSIQDILEMSDDKLAYTILVSKYGHEYAGSEEIAYVRQKARVLAEDFTAARTRWLEQTS